MRWKNGATWEAVPAAALYGTYRGTAQVAWPVAAEVDGLGRPTAAIGRPEIVIESAWLQDTGMAFWRAFFADSTATYAAISLEVFDPRVGSNVMYQGLLHRPTWASIGRGATADQTVYRNVQIKVTECEATT